MKNAKGKRVCAGCGGTDLIEFPGLYPAVLRMRRIACSHYVCRDCGLKMTYFDTNDLKKIERLPGDGE